MFKTNNIVTLVRYEREFCVSRNSDGRNIKKDSLEYFSVLSDEILEKEPGEKEIKVSQIYFKKKFFIKNFANSNRNINIKKIISKLFFCLYVIILLYIIPSSED